MLENWGGVDTWQADAEGRQSQRFTYHRATQTPQRLGALRIERIRVWSLVHGISMLLLDGQVTYSEAMIDKIFSARFRLG